MRKYYSILIIITAIFIDFFAYGQTKKGLNELNMSANFIGSSGSGNSGSVFQLGIAYGNYTTQKLEFGINFSLLIFDNSKSGNGGLFFEYHFPRCDSSTIVPFFGGQIGSMFGDNSVNMLGFGFFNGVKFFLSKNSAMSIQPFYMYYKKRSSTRSQYGILSGISIFF